MPRNRTWSGVDTAAISIVTSVAALVRAVRLTTPRGPVFDEAIYAADACYYAQASGKLCYPRELLTEHPPLGKWFITWGIDLFGHGPLGWRVAAVIAGIAMIPILYLLARRLLGSSLGATIAAGLLAVDFLHFVHSRIGMIEIFAASFGTAAMLFCVYDNDALKGPPRPDSGRGWSAHGLRPWRLAAGAALGAAIASKWTGLLFLAAVVVLSFAWEIRSRPETRRRMDAMLRREGWSLVVSFGLLPVAIYIVSHIARVEGTLLTIPWADGSWFRALWDRQFAAYDFHRYLEFGNVAESPPWSWLLVKRPIQYRLDRSGDTITDIVGGGSPILWWASIAAFSYIAVKWLRTYRRDYGRPEFVILIGFFATYLFWFVLAIGRERVFIYYALAALPFMCLALAYALEELLTRSWGRFVVPIYLAAAVATFAYAYPILAYVPLDRAAWEARMWIYDDCALRPLEPLHAALDRFLDAEMDLGPLRAALRGWCGM